MRLLLLLAVICAFMPARAVEWLPYTAGGVRVFVHPREATLATRIGEMAAGDLPRIAAAVGVTHPSVIDVYAYRSAIEFQRDTQDSPFTVGVSYSPDGTIRLDASRHDSGVRQTLAHELTHSLITQRLGSYGAELPTWVNEGIAGLHSDPMSRDDYFRVAMLTHRDGVFSIDMLERAFTTHEHNDVAYLQTRSMVSWLEAHYPGSIRSLLARIADGDSFADALHAVSGLTANSWLSQWMASVPDYLYWIMLLNSPVVYAPAALILVLLVAIRLRRRRALADNTPPTPSPKNDRGPNVQWHLPEE